VGTWGVGIFSDDTALDVRNDWRDLLGEGLDAETATGRLLEEWGQSANDPDEGPVVWLALAAAQMSTGRLTEEVRKHALSLIDSGADLRRWKGSSDLKRRQAVLQKFRSRMAGPQKAPVKVARRRLAVPRFQIGDAFTFRLANGMLALFRCYGMHTDKGGQSSLVELLDWTGTEVPAQLDFAKFPGRQHRYELVQTNEPAIYMPVETPRAHRFPSDRISLCARGLRVIEPRAAGLSVVLWSRMNDEIWLQLDPTWKPDAAAQEKLDAALRRARGT
jgi:hypothetical protein